MLLFFLMQRYTIFVPAGNYTFECTAKYNNNNNKTLVLNNPLFFFRPGEGVIKVLFYVLKNIFFNFKKKSEYYFHRASQNGALC